MATAQGLLLQGIAAYRADNRGEARRLFAEALHADRRYEAAWLWYATAANNDGERRYCLQRALALNPQSPAQFRLWRIPRQVTPAIPPDLADLEDPPNPPDFEDTPFLTDARAWLHLHRYAVRRLTVALLLLALVAGAVLFQRARSRDPLYIAVVGPMSGVGQEFGRAMVRGVEVYVDRVNAYGGIDGRPVRLLIYDDRDDPELARRRAEEIVGDGRALLVIGHGSTATSLAGEAIYRAANLSAITSLATGDDTDDDPWYFRTIFDSETEGYYLAEYLRQVLGNPTASVIYADTPYGEALNSAFEMAYTPGGTVRRSWRHESDPARRAASIERIAAEVAATPDAGTLFLALDTPDARDLIVALRRRGVRNQLIGADTLSLASFAGSFRTLPEERRQPGFFTDGLYVVAPLLFDSLGASAQRFTADYQRAYRVAPDWPAATSYEAAVVGLQSIIAAEIEHTPASRQEDRARIREQLTAITSPEAAILGLDRPIFFGARRASQDLPSIGRFFGAQLVSAPVQLRPASAPAAAPQPVRIVYAGIDINEVRSLDTRTATFEADFFLWFRYQGDDRVTRVTFPNAVDTALSLGEPLMTDEGDGLIYRLYHVSGTFKEQLDFRDFPFDRQHLTIQIQHQTLTTAEVIYAIDPLLRGRTQEERLRSGLDMDRPFNAINSWQAIALDVRQEAITSDAALGHPQLVAARTPVQFSRYVADVTLTRDVASFLTKNLLALALQALILYTTLFFRHHMAGARIATAISSLLTSAVLLNTMSSQIPNINYPTAIEYGFLVIFVLCFVCVIVGVVGDRWHMAGKKAALRRLDRAAQVIYPLTVLVVVMAYLLRYG